MRVFLALALTFLIHPSLVHPSFAAADAERDAAVETAARGCASIVANRMPPIRRLAGAKEVEPGLWRLQSEFLTAEAIPNRRECTVTAPSLAYDHDAAMARLSTMLIKERAAGHVDDLRSVDLDRVTPGLQGELNSDWIQFGARRLRDGGTVFIFRAQN